MASFSGMYAGGGPKYFPHKRKKWDRKDWEDILLSDWPRIREEVPDFDPDQEYSDRQLQMIAEKILINDPKPHREHPAILLAPHYIERAKREIYTQRGTPDPSIVNGLYWRTHPNGRKFIADPDERRKHDSSFYK